MQKLRYALSLFAVIVAVQQNSLFPQTPSAAPPGGDAFPAATELAVHDIATRKDVAAALSAGKLISLTAAQDPVNNRKQTLNWLRKNGADLFAETSGLVKGLVGLGLVVLPVDNDAWDKATISQVRDAVQQLTGGGGGGTSVMSARQIPATYVFRTRKGAVGVLQITAMQAPIISLRYKMSQPAVAKGVAPEDEADSDTPLYPMDNNTQPSSPDQSSGAQPGSSSTGQPGQPAPAAMAGNTVAQPPAKQTAPAAPQATAQPTAPPAPSAPMQTQPPSGKVDGLTPDFVIESRAQGLNYQQYKETGGKWIDASVPQEWAKSSASGLTEVGKCGARKLVISPPGAPPNTKGPGGVARFFPMVPKPAHYFVYTTWPKGGNCCPLFVSVKHAGGEDKKESLQDGWGIKGPSNSDRWLLLGDYDFTPGTDQYVELRAEKGVRPLDYTHWGQVVSDSVRFCLAPLQDAVALPPNAEAGSAVASSAAPGVAPGGNAGPGAAMPQPAPPGAAAPEGGSTMRPAPPPADGIKWQDSFVNAIAAADSLGKKRILLFYFDPKNEDSRHYEQLFTDPAVKAAVEAGFVPVKVNFGEKNELSQKLQMPKDGVIEVYDTQGNAMSRIGVRMPAAEFIGKLKSI